MSFKFPRQALQRIKLRAELQPGDLGYITYLHGILYAQEYGYDHRFEGYVAATIAEFAQSFSLDKDHLWLAELNGQIVGSIAVVGRSEKQAQIRWFLVHPDCRGVGCGRKLLREAIQFCYARSYESIYLWTGSELTAAATLYESVGFQRTEEKMHQLWGQVIAEERYDLHLSSNLV